MKHILTILPILSMVLTSCYKEPYADALIYPNPAIAEEIITFKNLSSNTNAVEWDMDDGYYYSSFNVTHYYDTPGFYYVTLKAFGRSSGVSVATFEVEVIGSLKVIVKEFYDEYTVSNARVRLYPTLADWDNETNLVAELYTNDEGSCIFTNLGYQRYYVDVFETWHDNYALGTEEGGEQWIETPLLDPDFYYVFTAYVDVYDTPAKKSATGTIEKKQMLKEESSGKTRPEKPTTEVKPKVGI